MEHSAWLLDIPLFEGISDQELPCLLDCLEPQVRTYPKGAVLFPLGETIWELGVVLEGSLHLGKEDYWGNWSLLNRVGPGELFGESYACAHAPMGVKVVAEQNTQVLFLDVNRMLTGCSKACAFHSQLMQNLLQILAQKNLQLSQKMDVLTQRTTRNKLLAYLSRQAREQGTNPIEIPFRRQQLADYLSVDRSAMTVELQKLVREGILQVEKNRFWLL